MHALSNLAIPILAALAVGLPHQASARDIDSPVGLTMLFTATLNVGTILNPIPIPGGVRVIEPFTNGTVTGPVFNGTIFGGIGSPRIYKNGTSQLPTVVVYGKTTDMVPFFVQEDGIGSPAAAFSRIQLEIGGKYASYSDVFILSSVQPSADRKTVVVTRYVPKLL